MSHDPDQAVANARCSLKLPEHIREEVVRRLFSFASIGRHGDRVVQKLVAAVSRCTLAAALIGADSAVHDAVTRNMSTRASSMLDEDIQSLIQAGELSTRDVHEARGEADRIFFELYESGDIGR